MNYVEWNWPLYYMYRCQYTIYVTTFIEHLPGLLSNSLLTTTLSSILISRACLPVMAGFTVTSSSSILPFFISVKHFVSLPDVQKIFNLNNRGITKRQLDIFAVSEITFFYLKRIKRRFFCYFFTFLALNNYIIFLILNPIRCY